MRPRCNSESSEALFKVVSEQAPIEFRGRSEYVLGEVRLINFNCGSGRIPKGGSQCGPKVFRFIFQ
eukprot:5921532-Alexandrium_andersonii.AAC.1